MNIWRPSYAEGRQDGFFEVHAENYMGAGGRPHHALERIRRDFPISLHGVCMSLGGPQPIDRAASRTLSSRSLNVMSRRWSPSIWHGRPTRTTYFNDLLPLPYTEATLVRVGAHMRAGAGRHRSHDSARKPFQLSRVSQVDDERDGLSFANWRAIPGAGCCSTSTTSSFRPPIRVVPRSAISRIFRSKHVGEIHLAGHAEQSR